MSVKQFRQLTLGALRTSDDNSPFESLQVKKDKSGPPPRPRNLELRSIRRSHRIRGRRVVLIGIPILEIALSQDSREKLINMPRDTMIVGRGRGIPCTKDLVEGYRHIRVESD
jgi:hypothetical protein